MKSITLFLSIGLLVACSPGKRQDSLVLKSSFAVENKNIRAISVSLDADDYFNRIDEYLRLTSCVKLAPEPLLAPVRLLQVQDGRIYVVDRLNRLVCYDMQGKVLFQIYAIGNGPGEYAGINAFTVDTDKKELVLYDNLRTSLLYYSADDGTFLRTERFLKPNPSEMVFFDHTFFYNNRDHKNYPNDTLLHYSLLSSSGGQEIKRYCFPHKEAEEEYIFSPSLQTFYRNENRLYYCKNFDNVVYQIKRDSVIARYRLDLPNLLTPDVVEDKPDEWKLVKSSYSFGVSHVYECKNLLYFCFTNGGFLRSVFYDLKKDEQICCVKVMQEKPTPEVPLFDLVDGVYQGKFFGLLTPEFIDYYVSKNPSAYPPVFRDYNADADNPLIAFYDIIR